MPLTYANYSGNPLMPVTTGNTYGPEWMEVELTADSGACDTVMPLSMCESIPVEPSPQSIAQIEYEVANKQTIPNLGQRNCLIWSETSETPRGITIQVADVHKPLLSLSRCADMGYQSVLGKRAGCLVDTMTGEILPLTRQGNLYTLRVWIKANPFVRQG